MQLRRGLAMDKYFQRFLTVRGEREEFYIL